MGLQSPAEGDFFMSQSTGVKLDLSAVTPLHVVLTDADIWATRIVPVSCGDSGCMILTDRERDTEELFKVCEAMQTCCLNIEVVSPDELTDFIRRHYPSAEAQAYILHEGPRALQAAIEADS
jgi:hypothetical protein